MQRTIHYHFSWCKKMYFLKLARRIRENSNLLVNSPRQAYVESRSKFNRWLVKNFPKGQPLKFQGAARPEVNRIWPFLIILMIAWEIVCRIRVGLSDQGFGFMVRSTSSEFEGPWWKTICLMATHVSRAPLRTKKDDASVNFPVKDLQMQPVGNIWWTISVTYRIISVTAWIFKPCIIQSVYAKV